MLKDNTIRAIVLQAKMVRSGDNLSSTDHTYIRSFLMCKEQLAVVNIGSQASYLFPFNVIACFTHDQAVLQCNRLGHGLMGTS